MFARGDDACAFASIASSSSGVDEFAFAGTALRLVRPTLFRADSQRIALAEIVMRPWGASCMR